MSTKESAGKSARSTTGRRTGAGGDTRAASPADTPPSLPIFTLRGQRVILDTDLARLYGVPTSSLNQAVHRNITRFPEDFAFQLTPHEATNLTSQLVISSSQLLDYQGKCLAGFPPEPPPSRRHGGRRHRPIHGFVQIREIRGRKICCPRITRIVTNKSISTFWCQPIAL